jgi:hypothetical protein
MSRDLVKVAWHAVKQKNDTSIVFVGIQCFLCWLRHQ